MLGVEVQLRQLCPESGRQRAVLSQTRTRHRDESFRRPGDRTGIKNKNKINLI